MPVDPLAPISASEGGIIQTTRSLPSPLNNGNLVTGCDLYPFDRRGAARLALPDLAPQTSGPVGEGTGALFLRLPA